MKEEQKWFSNILLYMYMFSIILLYMYMHDSYRLREIECLKEETQRLHLSLELVYVRIPPISLLSCNLQCTKLMLRKRRRR